MKAASRESRGDVLERQRRLEELPLERVALLVVPGRSAVAAGEPDADQAPPFVLEHRSLDVAVRDRLAVAADPLEQHAGRVALLEVGVEVDLAAEDVRERERQRHALAGGVEGRNERGALAGNLGPHRINRHLAGVRHQGHVELRLPFGRAIAEYHAQELAVVDLVPELPEQAVEPARELERAIGLQAARIEHRPHGGRERRHEDRIDLIVAQQGLERRRGRHAALDRGGVERQRHVAAVGVRPTPRGRRARRGQRGSHGRDDGNLSNHREIRGSVTHRPSIPGPPICGAWRPTDGATAARGN